MNLDKDQRPQAAKKVIFYTYMKRHGENNFQQIVCEIGKQCFLAIKIKIYLCYPQIIYIYIFKTISKI